MNGIWEGTMTDRTDLNVFFEPKSVAIVGASTDPKKPGHKVLSHLVSMGYRGKVFPINLHEKTILGFQCFRSIIEIPEPIEICVLLVSAQSIIGIAKELVERKQRFNDLQGAICISAGFGELNTEEAKLREQELVQILKAASIRLIGPNCLGIIDAYSGFNTNFDLATYPKGGISLLTQSGAFANSFLFWAESLQMAGLSKFASVGNMVDISIPELLSFLKEDETTRVIGIYMEGVPDPRYFFEIARQVSPVKPIVVLKSGRSAIGSTAARSHTGALAGIDALYDGAFKQTGIIRAKSVLEFFDTLRALERQPLPEGNRVCIVTHMGGPGTICLDEVSSAGSLQPAKLSAQTCKALRSICSPMANIGSPDGYVDLSAAHTEKLHNQVLEILFQDDAVDLVLQLLAPSAFIDQKLLVKEITNAYTSQGKHKKPLFNAVTFGQFAYSTRRGLEKERIPTFEYPDMLARVAGNVATYAEFQRKARDIEERRGIESYLPGTRMPAAELIAHALEEGRYNLLEPEAYRICEQYGICFPPFRVESSFKRTLSAAREIGYPVVLKVVDKEIIHKSAAGCVITGICSDSSFRDAYHTLRENAQRTVPDLKRLNFLIQKMVPSTMELALGALREKSFGPIVMVGLGGIHIEALKLVGFRLAPLCVSEAKDFIYQTIPSNWLSGLPDGDDLTVESIAKTLVSLGRMLEELPQIEEVDLNPTLLYQNSCMAVDARIMLSFDASLLTRTEY